MKAWIVALSVFGYAWVDFRAVAIALELLGLE